MEILKPSLIITKRNGDTPATGMCSECRAIFPTVEWNGPEANKRLLEGCFEEHVKAEHSDQAPPWESPQGNLQSN